MKVYMVRHAHMDGIDYDFQLFKSKADAKTECRKLNRKLGFEQYEVVEVEVK